MKTKQDEMKNQQDEMKTEVKEIKNSITLLQEQTSLILAFMKEINNKPEWTTINYNKIDYSQVNN